MMFLIFIVFAIPMVIFLFRSLTPDYEITIPTLVICGILLIWTALTFYLMGRASVMQYFYY